MLHTYIVSFRMTGFEKHVSEIIQSLIHPADMTSSDMLGALERRFAVKRHQFIDLSYEIKKNEKTREI
ncbi:MAG: hypothetical protein ACXWT0_01750 [Methylobacter sp.]